jgi:putative DNA primase/helicase
VPEGEIIILADNGLNVPREAQDAALAVGGRVAIPELEGRKCDFWDLWHERGVEAVQRAIADAKAPARDETRSGNGASPGSACGGEGWSEPQPLTVKVAPEPYPLDALPEIVRKAVTEVQGFIKAPVPLVASSALAALSISTQAHIDVRRANKLEGPSGLFELTIADSSERKTTCDGFFMSAIREYEAAQAKLAEPEVKEYEADIAAWTAEREGTLSAIKEASKKCKATDNLRANLAELEKHKPKPPRVPKLLRMDDTPENLAWVLAKEWPSAGVASSEAGIVFGAHAMGKDSIMRNMALLNILWDGGTLSIGRRTSESFTVKGARLTVALQIQEMALRSFYPAPLASLPPAAEAARPGATGERRTPQKNRSEPGVAGGG